MISKFIAVIFSFVVAGTLYGQNDIPYYQIPDYPDEYTSETVAARLVDGLGYRYYWATDGLRLEDLAYKPSEDSRALEETLEHLYNLSSTIVNAMRMEANVRPSNEEEWTWEQTRKKTLENFAEASDILKSAGPGDVANFEIVFQRGDRKSSFPFWNLVNGPITDAIYHTGQVVAFRRASGNPLNPNVNVFIGKNRE